MCITATFNFKGKFGETKQSKRHLASTYGS